MRALLVAVLLAACEPPPDEGVVDAGDVVEDVSVDCDPATFVLRVPKECRDVE